MFSFTRRQFGGLLAALGARPGKLFGVGNAGNMDAILRTGIERRGIPAVAAMIANANGIAYSGAFGVPAGIDSIFSIASMTKAITSVAAMQMVEQGKVALDEPMARLLPNLGKVRILEGFDAAGKPMLRPASTPITLKHLLTHTSGFCYDTWHEGMFRYATYTGTLGERMADDPPPLQFEPGTRWQYGYSTEWAGRLVEALSGLTLEQYFQRNIFAPLGMKDTSFILPSEKFDRLVSEFQKEPDGKFREEPRVLPKPPQKFNGGGGLYSTVGDYTRFMQTILRGGLTTGRDRLLKAETIETMARNQIGDLSAGKLKSVRPETSADLDFHPGFKDGFGLGFLINATAYPGGRSAGTLAWAGLENTYYWIDRRRALCAVIMMRFHPFGDPLAMGLLSDFEHAVYASV